MKKPVCLSCIVLLTLIMLAAAPVAAAALPAAVTCPSSCACLLPAEAAKINTPGLCGGKQILCGTEGKNEKYCYEKPGTTTTKEPQIILTGYHIITPATTTIAPQKCAEGCICLSSADGKGKGLLYCGGKQTICRYTGSTPLYCFTLPETAVPAVPAVVTEQHVIIATPVSVMNISQTPGSCSSGCSCLSADKAGATGYVRCSADTISCGTDPLGRAMYCYRPGKVSALATVEVLPTSQLIPAVISTTPTSPATSGSIASPLDILIAVITGRSPRQSSTPSRRILCNGSLVNAWTDPANCGSCGAFCTEGLVCSMGQCMGSRDPTFRSACGAFQIQCNGTCSNYLHDDENCGRCGNRCSAPETCCNGHCITTDNNPENCGRCANRCGENATCSSGSCICINSTIRCGTVCADPETSKEHCGGCNIQCGTGEACCAGHCIDVTRNGMNCGACGNNCGTDIYCIDGRCVDPETNEEHCGDAGIPCDSRRNWWCCNGVCSNISSNPSHCGGCNRRCDPGETCIYSRCINLQTNVENCGSLGHWCTGLSDTCCNGQCVDLYNDEKNCGQCGHRCAWYEKCDFEKCCPWYDPFCGLKENIE